jgi:hypothetical protein
MPSCRDVLQNASTETVLEWTIWQLEIRMINYGLGLLSLFSYSDSLFIFFSKNNGIKRAMPFLQTSPSV